MTGRRGHSAIRMHLSRMAHDGRVKAGVRKVQGEVRTQEGGPAGWPDRLRNQP